ncbi:MAG: diphthine--ammonia ligase [Candidatus Pacearchaeota archaeon]
MARKKLRLGILFSGGKDSCLALDYALKNEKVCCLITIISKNKNSYMFHTPNIRLVEKQAQAIGLPLIIEYTEGEKEKELFDLEKAIIRAIKIYKIDGVVTGAIASIYQSSRIQKICNKLNIECFNPLWQRNQIEILNEIVEKNFDVIITGVYAEGLEELIGKKIDISFIEKIKKLQEKYKINPAGEGGELESFVLDTNFFKKKIIIKDFGIFDDYKGEIIMKIKDVYLINKEKDKKK